MKRILLAVLAMALIMTSCLENTHSDYTPQIGSTYFIRNAQDTLHLQYDKEKNLYLLDTITMNDTVRFATLFDAQGNNLLSACTEWDSTCLIMEFGPWTKEIEYALTDASDTINGKLYFNKGYNFVSIPTMMTTVKPSTSRLKFTITSDSEFSPTAVDIQVVVKEEGQIEEENAEE